MTYAPALRALNRRCLSSNSSRSRSAFSGAAFAARSASCAPSLARRAFSAGVRWSGIALRFEGREFGVKFGAIDTLGFGARNHCFVARDALGNGERRFRSIAAALVVGASVKHWWCPLVRRLGGKLRGVFDVHAEVNVAGHGDDPVVCDLKQVVAEEGIKGAFGSRARCAGFGEGFDNHFAVGQLVSPRLMPTCNANPRYVSNGKMRYGENISGDPA